MHRRLFTVGGVVSGAVAVAVAALFTPVVLDVPAFAVWVVAFLVSGVLSILGGEGRSVAGYEWHQLIGLSYVVFGLGMVVWSGWWALTHLGDTTVVALGAGMALGALVLVEIGHDWVRDPRYFDRSALE